MQFTIVINQVQSRLCHNIMILVIIGTYQIHQFCFSLTTNETFRPFAAFFFTKMHFKSTIVYPAAGAIFLTLMAAIAF